VQVVNKPVTELCWTNLGSLEYINTTTGIAFGLVYCNADTPIWYVHFFDEPMFVNGIYP